MFVPANLVSVVFDYLQPDKYKQLLVLVLCVCVVRGGGGGCFCFLVFCMLLAVQAPNLSAVYKNTLRLC